MINHKKIIARYPPAYMFELSSKARQRANVINRFKHAIGFMPKKLAEKFQGTSNSADEVNRHAHRIVNEFPLEGYFSTRLDPIGHPMLQMKLQQHSEVLDAMMWAIVFEDLQKHMGISLEVFNFLNLKFEVSNGSVIGCVVCGYELDMHDDGEDGGEPSAGPV